MPAGIKDLLQRPLAQIHGNRFLHQRGVSYQPGQASFQFTDVAVDLAGDQLKHFIRHFDILLHGLFPQDGHAGIHVRTLDVRHQAPLEPAAQPFLQALDILRRFIACQDDLLVLVMQFIEGVEELLLGTFTAGDKLDIVHHQHVHLPDLFPEFVGLLHLDGADQLIGEVLTGHVQDLLLGIRLVDEVADGLHQVGFAQSHTAVDKQRVIGFRRAFRHGQRGRVRKPVAVAHNEALKGVLRIQVGIGIVGSLFLIARIQPGLHLFLVQQHDPDRFARHFAQLLLDQGGILVLDHGDHALHFDRDEQGIILQQSGNHVAVDPRVVRHEVHFPRQQGTGLLPERLHIHQSFSIHLFIKRIKAIIYFTLVAEGGKKAHERS